MEAEAVPLHHVVNTALSGIEAFLPFQRTVPRAHVAGDLSGETGDWWRGSAERCTGASPYHDQQGGLAVRETGALCCGSPCAKA